MSWISWSFDTEQDKDKWNKTQRNYTVMGQASWFHLKKLFFSEQKSSASQTQQTFKFSVIRNSFMKNFVMCTVASVTAVLTYWLSVCWKGINLNFNTNGIFTILGLSITYYFTRWWCFIEQNPLQTFWYTEHMLFYVFFLYFCTCHISI